MEFRPWLKERAARRDDVGNLALDISGSLHCKSPHAGEPDLYTPETLDKAIREWLSESLDCTGCGEPHPRLAMLGGDGSFVGWCIECDTFEKAAP